VKLRWTRLALEDLNSAYELNSAENPSAAAKMSKKIKAAVKVLRTYPNLGRAGRVDDNRELVIPGTPFIVAYHFGRNQVEILAEIHATRRWPSSF